MKIYEIELVGWDYLSDEQQESICGLSGMLTIAYSTSCINDAILIVKADNINNFLEKVTAIAPDAPYYDVLIYDNSIMSIVKKMLKKFI